MQERFKRYWNGLKVQYWIYIFTTHQNLIFIYILFCLNFYDQILDLFQYTLASKVQSS